MARRILGHATLEGFLMQRASLQSIQPTKARRSRLKPNQVVTIVGFLLPSAIFYIGLVLLPVFQAVYYSFFRWNGLGPLQNFTNVRNYQLIASNSVFLGALGHNALLAGLSLVIQLPLALGLALLVGRSLRGRSF